MTKSEVAKLVAVMCATYPNAKVTAETSGAYERMLGDLDYPAACAAVEQLLAVSKWMPTVAEIRERVLSLTVGDVKPGGEAWGLVLKAISRYGYDRRPGVDFEFSDPVVAECVKALNWRELCSSENQVADRARFVDLYDQLAVSSRRKQLSEGLPAMQRFRALQAAQAEKALAAGGESAEPQAIGRLLKLAMPGGDS